MWRRVAKLVDPPLQCRILLKCFAATAMAALHRDSGGGTWDRHARTCLFAQTRCW